MRDHPYHGEHIMGGMFGIAQTSEESKKARSEEFHKMIVEYGWKWKKGQDQVFIFSLAIFLTITRKDTTEL
jgi:hypothetical protein